MKKCNICGEKISSKFKNIKICNTCNNNNEPIINYQSQQIFIVLGYMLLGGIYLYGSFYANVHYKSIFENHLNWFLVDFFGLFIVYLHNSTPAGDFMTGSDGIGPFFAIPAVTIVGFLNLFIPDLVSLFFWNFPFLNFIAGATCLWTGFSNIKGQNII